MIPEYVWHDLTVEETQYFHMNWPILTDYYYSAVSKQMSKKEASDLISQIWELMKFMHRSKSMWDADPKWVWEAEFDRLLSLSVVVYSRMHDSEE